MLLDVPTLVDLRATRSEKISKGHDERCLKRYVRIQQQQQKNDKNDTNAEHSSLSFGYVSWMQYEPGMDSFFCVINCNEISGPTPSHDSCTHARSWMASCVTLLKKQIILIKQTKRRT